MLQRRWRQNYPHEDGVILQLAMVITSSDCSMSTVRRPLSLSVRLLFWFICIIVIIIIKYSSVCLLFGHIILCRFCLLANLPSSFSFPLPGGITLWAVIDSHFDHFDCDCDWFFCWCFSLLFLNFVVCCLSLELSTFFLLLADRLIWFARVRRRSVKKKQRKKEEIQSVGLHLLYCQPIDNRFLVVHQSLVLHDDASAATAHHCM